jgi:hypothetical protein
MKMKLGLIPIAVFVLVSVVVFSCVFSEIAWSNKEKDSDSLRGLVGLPSIVVGNLNPAARNPGLEVLCPGLYDVPGGSCSYFAGGVPFVGSPFNLSITVRGSR